MCVCTLCILHSWKFLNVKIFFKAHFEDYVFEDR